ncbi:hypothetical protein LguiA_004721 [Lonicera macranthoides]
MKGSPPYACVLESAKPFHFVSRFLSLTAALTPTVPTTRHFSHTHNSFRRSSPLASLSTVAGPSPSSPVHTPSFNRYEALYAKMIPKSMTGENFLEEYTDHNDLVTVVDNKRSYGVENNIVGAPCGVMDQMTSACGEANQLLAMVCQITCAMLNLTGSAIRPEQLLVTRKSDILE